MHKESRRLVKIIREELREELKIIQPQQAKWRWTEQFIIGFATAAVFSVVLYLVI